MSRSKAESRPKTLGSYFRTTLLALGSLWLVSGCASAPHVFGNQARFSPAFQGYVMAKPNGSDDPGVHDTVLLLRDPLTGAKLRCQKDVVTWRELYEDFADDKVEDENAAVAAGITTAALFGPLLIVHPLGGLVLAEALLTNGLIYDDLRSDTATQLLAHGIRLYKRQRYAQAAAMIERALAKDAAVGVFDKAYLYLGLSYQRQGGNTSRARLALSMFIDHAGVRDVDAYREAEKALASLGVQRIPCASAEPVALHW